MTMRRRDRGLTLLEILVATALLAILFASVYSIVSSTVTLRNQIEEGATPFAVGPAVMDLVVEDLRAATIEPYKDLDAFHAESETHDGETCTKLDFVSCIPSRKRVRVQDEEVKARLNEVGYRMKRSETKRGLYALYRREDLGVDDDPLEGGKYYKLADSVKVFRVDWFPEDPGDPTTDDAKGEEEWDAKKEKRLPWGCRVTLRLMGDVPTDDQGNELGEPPEYAFVTFVVFASRHDKADQPQPPRNN
jgi:prepilin-type N-terminal cleavage/methylation domain-containing protein